MIVRHRGRLVLVVLALPLVLAIGCLGSPPATPPNPDDTHRSAGEPRTLPGEPFFVDVTESTGIRHQYDNGEDANEYTMLETIGGGASLIDYDRDGWLDGFLAGGGRFTTDKRIFGAPSRLYRNEGNWRFRDVTKEVGLDVLAFYTHGATVADYDNDGWPDLLVTGYGRLALYRNDQGVFRDVTAAAKLTDQRAVHWSTAAAFGDLNGDNHLDLFVVHYVDWSFQNHPRCTGYGAANAVDTCSPRQFNALPDSLFLGNGDGTFRDASFTSGLKQGSEGGKGLGVVVADFNEDGLLDVYVANDTTANQLYLNQGKGRFEEVGVAMNVAHGENGKPDGSMGVDAADYDGSGRLSIFVVNFQGEVHALYRNGGAGRPFHNVSTRAGVAALGQNFVGFGAGFVDFDLDGYEDFLISNGHVARYPVPPATLAQRAVLLRNERKPGDKPVDVRFRDVSKLAGPYFEKDHRGRGMALGDLDNDGKPDVVLNHVNEPVIVLRNNASYRHGWLGVELRGREQVDAIGAVATLDQSATKLVRVRKGGCNFVSANDHRIVFGLGNQNDAGKLTVRWPSGLSQSWNGLTPNRYWRVVEGQTAAVDLGPKVTK